MDDRYRRTPVTLPRHEPITDMVGRRTVPNTLRLDPIDHRSYECLANLLAREWSGVDQCTSVLMGVDRLTGVDPGNDLSDWNLILGRKGKASWVMGRTTNRPCPKVNERKVCH